MPWRRHRRPALRVALITVAAFGVGALGALAVSDSGGSGGALATIPATSAVPESALPTTVPVTATTVAPSTTLASVTSTSSPPTVTDPVVAADLPAVEAKAYIVYDATAGAEMAASNADAALAVGSIQKLLTAYVVMQAGDPDKLVTVPALQINPKESQIGLYAGEQLSRAVLLRAMLIVSANDAARALAIDVAGSEAAFVDEMNAAALTLGLHDTVVVNPTGLDAEGQHSTARDVLTLSRALMADETFRATVVRTSATLHGQVYKATDPLVGWYPGADGVKTGHTTEAGYCFAARATRDGRTIYVVELGAPTLKARVSATTALLDWAFAHPV